MRKFAIFIISLLYAGTVFSQSYFSEKRKDSISNNRYSKDTKYVGGFLPGGDIFFSLSPFKIKQYSLTGISAAGYFLKNNVLISTKSEFNYTKFLYKENNGVNVFGILSFNSLVLRRYFHPKTFSFHFEISADYANFYSHRTFYNNLPAKLYHIGSVSSGIGVNLFSVKRRCDISFTLTYTVPLLYEKQATKYEIFDSFNGIAYYFGLFYLIP